MARWMAAVVLVFLVLYGATVIVTGNPEYLIPAVVLALLLGAYALVNWALTRRIVHREGSLEEAMSDNTDAVPSTHLIPDDETAAGDTPEAHDEISPHDLPIDHPARPAAEEQAARNAGGARFSRPRRSATRENA
jgi:hypothetical protein